MPRGCCFAPSSGTTVPSRSRMRLGQLEKPRLQGQLGTWCLGPRLLLTLTLSPRWLQRPGPPGIKEAMARAMAKRRVRLNFILCSREERYQHWRRLSR